MKEGNKCSNAVNEDANIIAIQCNPTIQSTPSTQLNQFHNQQQSNHNTSINATKTHLPLKKAKGGQVIRHRQGQRLVQLGACAADGNPDDLHVGC